MLKNALKLYCSPYSPPSRGVILVIKALNLNVDYKTINVLSSQYQNSDLLVINPQHTVPTLKDGNFAIWDSHAIAGYLAGKYGINDDLYPRDPKRRAVVDQKLYFDTEHLLPKVTEAIQPLLFREATMLPDHLFARIIKSYKLLEVFLSKSNWLAGDNMTIADLCCVSSISTLDFLVPIKAEKYPNLVRFLTTCNKLPYYFDANQVGLNMLGNKIQERMVSTYVKRLYNK